MKTILPQIKDTKKVAGQIARCTPSERSEMLNKILQAVESDMDFIIQENTRDADKMDDQDPKKDRLILNRDRVCSMVKDGRRVMNLPDPTGVVLCERILDSGLALQKKTVPLGVVGIIYESRPNVTLDAITLALKSGNAVILRGGSDAEFSNKAIVKIAQKSLVAQGFDPRLIQLLPTDRALVKELLVAEKYVDILIPRGSQGLIQFVRENSKIPTIETGAGVCHTFVEATADLDMAQSIVENAKLQRPSVCNALDTILIAASVAEDFLPRLIPNFQTAEMELYADSRSFTILHRHGYSFLKKAHDGDFGREFLGFGASIRVVDDFQMALDHIAEYSSRHSEAIVTQNLSLAERFLAEVDAAAVYHNASTRFTDGAVFGLGAEMGISTQKLHARGPFALEKLVTEKWILRGSGQIR
jgi:glutamate-5-semialdehyde dehydrogenase